MKIKYYILFLLLPAVLHAQKKVEYEKMLQPAVFSLTMVMVHDVVNPPAASRYYAYCTLGAYDIVARHSSDVIAPSVFIKNYQPVVINQSNYNYQIAALYCIYETGRLMLPSGFMLEEKQQAFINDLKKSKVAQSIIDTSIAVAKDVAAQEVAWAKTDDYNKLSARLRYTPSKGDGNWYPTPPGYIEAIEPNWKTVRPMMIDSCNQFVPAPPVAFSKDTTSEFYALAKEVYDAVNHLSDEQLTIASFWDCNPFAINTSGHMMIGFKKMSPGGHWMNITGIVAQQAKLSFDACVLLHLTEAVTLMDAFISCWDEKYRSNRIRPETYINKYMDVRWQPLLQTPPFPEYTSGHSVISTASAEVLSYFLGDNFSFSDNSEELFQIKERHFTSFRQAAAEAAISRLYGGIHYRDAIVNGQAEGKLVGDFIVAKLKASGFKPLL